MRSLPGILLAILAVGCETKRPDSPLPDSNTPAVDSKLDIADNLHRQGKTAAAMTIVQQLLITTPEDVETLSLAAKLHDQLGQYCEAGDLARKIAELDISSAPAILIRAFEWHLRGGQYASAEADLKRAVELAPSNPQIHRWLAQLLTAQGRRIEASQHVKQLIRLRDFQHNELLSLIDLSGPFSLVDYGDLIDETKTSLFQLGEARLKHVSATNPREVLELVQQVREAFPHSQAAAAFHGRLLAETGRFDQLASWLGKLPSGVEAEPEYWNALGAWLAEQERHHEAIRALGEALRRDPTDRQSMRKMILVLNTLGDDPKSSQLRQRLLVLDQIFQTAKDADADQAEWIANRLQELTRPWEATAWLVYSARLSGKLQAKIPDLQRRHDAIVAWETGSSIEQIREARLLRMLDFSIDQYPLPDLDRRRQAATTEPIANLNSGLQFQDVASQVGLVASFESGYPLDRDEFLIYQANGGGIAAVDYDLDGRCDLYLAQSGGTPLKNDSAANQLFRLLEEQRFIEVTDHSQTGNRGFGQGICAGDVNQDGFPDLLIANIGGNVLLINQGDGAFLNASHLIADNANDWTSSLGLADLNGDHLPEIFEVNYIDDPRAYTVKCQGRQLNCQPQRFTAASDRIHLSRGDGVFSAWQQMQQIGTRRNYGFGLVIANFDQQHGNDVFISNDGDVNHYWTSQPIESAGRFSLIESAGIRGVSIGPQGSSQACMGIASGDFNRDGTLDLHVTNFHNESVNLFLQNKKGFFADESLKYGLTAASYGLLGFGTQAADFDNDGWLDLAVGNGHIYDASYANIPFRMRSQVMRGSQQGFAVQDQISAGAYWQQKQLARTLASWDFDDDGRVDLVANHLDQPLALLRNASAAGNWLQLELIGIRSERDAIGARVEVTAGDETWSAWQTGGDGYMCTNQPLIHIGMGSARAVDRVTVQWPSGERQTISRLKLNARYLVVEGQGSFERELANKPER